MSTFSVVRRVWHLLPDPVRASVATFPPVRLMKSIIRPTQKDEHNQVYNSAYYADVDATTRLSAPTIVRSIVRDLAPKTAFDVGCGTGAMLDELRTQGVPGAGLEYSEAGLAYCRARGLKVRQFNLETDRIIAPDTLFDVVLSTEVAEHLPESLAEPFVDAVVSQSRTVVFTAATPGQGGTDHVNEQPHQYWIDKFARRGYAFDETLSNAWRSEWNADKIAFWYANNVMVFRR